jgi:hypothetical protein
MFIKEKFNMLTHLMLSNVNNNLASSIRTTSTTINSIMNVDLGGGFVPVSLKYVVLVNK